MYPSIINLMTILIFINRYVMTLLKAKNRQDLFKQNQKNLNKVHESKQFNLKSTYILNQQIQVAKNQLKLLFPGKDIKSIISSLSLSAEQSGKNRIQTQKRNAKLQIEQSQQASQDDSPEPNQKYDKKYQDKRQQPSKTHKINQILINQYKKIPPTRAITHRQALIRQQIQMQAQNIKLYEKQLKNYKPQRAQNFANINDKQFDVDTYYAEQMRKLNQPNHQITYQQIQKYKQERFDKSTQNRQTMNLIKRQLTGQSQVNEIQDMKHFFSIQNTDNIFHYNTAVRIQKRIMFDTRNHKNFNGQYAYRLQKDCVKLFYLKLILQTYMEKGYSTRQLRSKLNTVHITKNGHKNFMYSVNKKKYLLNLFKKELYKILLCNASFQIRYHFGFVKLLLKYKNILTVREKLLELYKQVKNVKQEFSYDNLKIKIQKTYRKIIQFLQVSYRRLCRFRKIEHLSFNQMKFLKLNDYQKRTFSSRKDGIDVKQMMLDYYLNNIKKLDQNGIQIQQTKIDEESQEPDAQQYRMKYIGYIIEAFINYLQTKKHLQFILQDPDQDKIKIYYLNPHSNNKWILQNQQKNWLKETFVPGKVINRKAWEKTLQKKKKKVRQNDQFFVQSDQQQKRKQKKSINRQQNKQQQKQSVLQSFINKKSEKRQLNLKQLYYTIIDYEELSFIRNRRLKIETKIQSRKIQAKIQSSNISNQNKIL